MKIKSIQVKNVKSFREKVEVSLNDDFNILIGPNGSGKSNLLDIITICLKHFFLIPYAINENNDDQGFYKTIIQIASFQNISQFLEKFYDDVSESEIIVNFVITKEDIENIYNIANNITEFQNVLSTYRNSSDYIHFINNVKNWKSIVLEENEILSYKIINYNVDFQHENKKNQVFFEYLNYFELILILIRDLPMIRLKTNYIYFTPYRSDGLQNLQANLSNQNFYRVLQNVNSATSKSTLSLINLATIYFAEKRRMFEDGAAKQGYEINWKNDEEVKLVTKYLEKLGYSWDLQLIDKNKNIYEIILSKEGNNFFINQASSGEKEIINFLLGIFAFNINNGIIVVDEPELHLHPKWQNVLLDLFTEFSSLTKNQFILSTHSATFINERSFSYIIRIYKDENNVSKEITLKECGSLNLKDILHIINSTNNEKIFFADVVILVEGITDRLVFEKILAEQVKQKNSTKIVEVIEIKGKSNVDIFKKFLSSLNIPTFFICDLDYINEVDNFAIKKLFVTNNTKIVKDVIKNPKSKDGDSLIKALEEAISSTNIDDLTEIWDYIKSFRRKLKPNLTEEESKLLNEFLDEQKKCNNYILQLGDIEDYFPDGFKKKDLNNVMNLLQDDAYEKWKNESEFNKLQIIINEILNTSKLDR